MTDRPTKLYQGSKCFRLSERPGIYAWYYRPIDADIETAPVTIGRLDDAPGRLESKIVGRYAIEWTASGDLLKTVGRAGDTVESLVRRAFQLAPQSLATFIQTHMAPAFAKPLYVGITNTLRTRVYTQHYQSLVSHWERDSELSQFLKAHPDAGVGDALSTLAVKQSFALEARVRGVRPQDLLVAAKEVDFDPGLANSREALEALETAIHAITDPVCGRA